MEKRINNQNTNKGDIGGVYFSEGVAKLKTGLGFDTQPHFQKLVEDIQKHFLFSRENIKLVLGVYLANNIKGNPVWVLIVSPSSSGKTELIFLLRQAKNVIPISDLTPQTLISGKEKFASLLLKIPAEVPVMLLVKDFTTILELPQEKRAAIFSQLREVYDGYYSKAFGTGEKVDWEGKIGILGGVTQIWETHYTASQILGERFLLWRLDYTEKEKKEITRKSLDNQKEIKNIRQELQKKIGEFLSIILQEKKNIELSENEKKRIETLAWLVAEARSQIVRNGYKREIDYIPDAELPVRIATQLAQLLIGLKLVEDDTPENFRIIKKIALDCIPDKRRKIIEIALTEENPLNVSQLMARTKLPETTLNRALEELEIREILTKKHYREGLANEWFLSEKWKEALNNFESAATPETLERTKEEGGLPKNIHTPTHKEKGEEINDDSERVKNILLSKFEKPEDYLSFLRDLKQDNPELLEKMLEETRFVSQKEFRDISEIEKDQDVRLRLQTIYLRILNNYCGFKDEVFRYIYKKYCENGQT